MKIDVDPHVFNVVHPAVARLASGKVSVQWFALTLQPEDPFIIAGDTIYALSEAEYYAKQWNRAAGKLSEQEFADALRLKDDPELPEALRKELADVAAMLPSCPACQYKHYHNKVRKLIVENAVLSDKIKK